MEINDMILFEDRAILVCHKPSGLPVQSAGAGTRDLKSLLMNYLYEQQQAMPYLGLIHRLDQPVEGILVFAKNKKAAAELSKQVTDGRMEKRYQAVCCGADVENGSLCEKQDCTEEEHDVSGEAKQKNPPHHLVNYLKKDARTNTSAIVTERTPGSKKAELMFRIKDEKKREERRYCLAEIQLLTGRHHQIRVQMAGTGLPLYGDQKYNRNWQMYRQQEYETGTRTQLALCACSLAFYHPSTKKRMQFEVRPSTGIFSIFTQESERVR
ncbi:MAG: RluA family pseudouridine synthase [Lachnospiraceae bacterium]|nr:RluA family pseudouridine synthase [Lachnospiraceae bacterium]